jgi:hypothetical protein
MSLTCFFKCHICTLIQQYLRNTSTGHTNNGTTGEMLVMPVVSRPRMVSADRVQIVRKGGEGRSLRIGGRGGGDIGYGDVSAVLML